ncbi:MAG: DNA lyase [Xanthomonadales bacterium]|nr:DNA lyase [Xanthomonadales bacterium]
MRLWSLHPRYLDARGLVALWREGLLARAVLRGQTRGYRRHPQLDRFRACSDPALAIDAYLAAVYEEAVQRGYRFDRTKIGAADWPGTLAVSDGQLLHEWRHLRARLALRSPAVFAQHADVAMPDCHPVFRIEPGPVADWERSPPPG